MKTNKKYHGLIVGLIIVMLATLFASCSTFPTAEMNRMTLSYEVLGFVGSIGSFSSYDAALTAAKEKFPNADGVITVSAKADNKLFSAKKDLGYYAIKFTNFQVVEKKGLFSR